MISLALFHRRRQVSSFLFNWGSPNAGSLFQLPLIRLAAFAPGYELVGRLGGGAGIDLVLFARFSPGELEPPATMLIGRELDANP